MNKNNDKLKEAIFNPPPKKKSTRAPPNYEDKYPEGMKKFIHQWLGKKWHREIEDMCRPGKKLWRENCDMRYIYYYHLINTFLNTEFQDQSIYKRVRDLPIEERFLAVDCLGCYLGLNPHNGNIHLLQILKKYKDLQD